MDIRGSNISGINIQGENPLYEFLTYTFTNANSIGRTGPTLSNLRAIYDTSSNTWINSDDYFTATDGIQLWTVPRTGTYTITARGAQGVPTAANAGGVGAVVQGDFQLLRGEKIRILVGQTATSTVSRLYKSSPGGGGSFVVRQGDDTVTGILVIAGGGGGTGSQFEANANASLGTSGLRSGPAFSFGNGGSNGLGGSQGDTGAGAGGGYLGNGATSTGNGGTRFISGGAGGIVSATYAPTGGGFGGGGSVIQGLRFRYGGGGGFSGGGGSNTTGDNAGEGATTGNWGGGGGSYNAGANQIMLGNIDGNFGNGSVTVTFVAG